MTSCRKILSSLLAIILIFSCISGVFTVYAKEIEHVYAINDSNIRIPFGPTVDFDQSGGCETMVGYGMFNPTDKLNITGKKLTLGLYVSFRDDNGGNAYDIISKGNQYGIRFYPETAQLEFYIYDETQAAASKRQSVIWNIPDEIFDNWYSDNDFRKIVATYDGSDMNLYFALERTEESELVGSKKTNVSISSSSYAVGLNANAETGSYAYNAVTLAVIANGVYSVDDIDDGYATCVATGYGTYPSDFTMFFLPISSCFGMFEEYDPNPPAVDLTELKNLVDNTEKLDAEIYTQTSFKAVTDALVYAKSVINSSNPTTDDVSSAISKIQAAVNGLVKLANTSELKALIAKAEAIDPEKYTADSYANLQNAISAARSILDDKNLTENELAPIQKALSDAIDDLVLKTDKSSLEQLIAKASAIQPDDYTVSSFAALSAEIDAACTVLDNAAATEADVKNAVSKLQATIDDLVSLAPLRAVIDSAKKFTDGSIYTEESFASFTSALEEAKNIEAKSNATQKEVSDAASKLQTAISRLEFNIESDVAAPVSAAVNETFTVIVKLASSYSGIKLFNEKGAVVGISSVSSEASDNATVWTLTTKIGTSGSGRQLTVMAKMSDGTYVDSGLKVNIDIYVPTNADSIKANVKTASFSASSVKKSEKFNLTARTTTNANGVKLYNENGSTIGLKLVSKTVSGSTIIWNYSLSIGTPGIRSFALAAYNEYGVVNEESPYILPLVVTAK